MTAGRPRTVSFPPDDMIALGEELISWLDDNPDTLHLSQWYSRVKHFTFKQWDAMTQLPEFLPYYEQALQTVGLQYLDRRSNVRDGISQRWQRLYFRDLRKHEDADADAEAMRRANALKAESAADQAERQRVIAEIERGKQKLE